MFLQSWIPSDSFPSDLPPNPTSAQIHRDLEARAETMAEPFRTIFESLPNDVRYYHNQLSYWIPKPWDNRNGTITLVGDAAHPMTFREFSASCCVLLRTANVLDLQSTDFLGLLQIAVKASTTRSTMLLPSPSSSPTTVLHPESISMRKRCRSVAGMPLSRPTRTVC